MSPFVRGLRGDLRLSLRPACVLVLIGVAIIAGLLSAMMQDVSYRQIGNARAQIRAHSWDRDCHARTAACRSHRKEGRGFALAFLRDQTRVATRVGALQSPPGVVRYGAAFVGLGTGLFAIALLATLVVAGEWERRTVGLALTRGVTPAGLALRRFTAVCLLGIAVLGAAVTGAILAAWWGSGNRPLLSGAHVNLAKPVLGVAALILAYAAVGTAVAWWRRSSLSTLLFTLAAGAAIALTTSFGTATPGSAVPGVLGIHRVLEVEIGYLWIWPRLTFPPDGASAVHIVSSPTWGAAVLWVLVIAAAAGVALAWQARRVDPLR